MARKRCALLLAVPAGVALLLGAMHAAAAGNSIATPEPFGVYGGYFTSIELDATGRPVISQSDGAGDLKVVRCGNPNCTSGNTDVAPDPGAVDVGKYTSLALDAAGYPIVSYQDYSNNDLKLVHCGDATCASGNTIATPDSVDNTGYYTALALDGAGKPVVTYFDINGALHVLHCGDANCLASNTIVTPDPTSAGAYSTSLMLDAAGYPVVAYYDYNGGDLKVLHCGDANCTAANSIATPDGDGLVGLYPSLALDTAGYPIVAYMDLDHLDLKVLHCGNAECTSGNSVTTPDSAGSVGQFASLTMDSAGRPVVAYFDASNTTLKVLRCGNANCTAGNTIRVPDPLGNVVNSVGSDASLALDSAGNPVVAYRYDNGGQLRVLHCSNATCDKPATPTATSAPATPTLTSTSAAAATGTPTRTATRTPTRAATPPAAPAGDANCDGTANAVDATIVLQFAAGLAHSLPCQAAADVNLSGIIDSIDALVILQYVAGLIPSLPP